VQAHPFLFQASANTGMEKKDMLIIGVVVLAGILVLAPFALTALSLALWVAPSALPSKSECSFDQPGFTCSGPHLVANPNPGGAPPNNVIYADIASGNAALRISAIACVAGRNPVPSGWVDNSLFKTDIALESSGSLNLGKYTDASGNKRQTVCYGNWNGGQLPSGKNADFDGRIYIAYTLAGEKGGYPPKVIAARLIAKPE